ncbi:MAG: hypothetical protein Q8O00_02435 [Holophaga sp.]|nr:hypothetical protein [Holophaga sp.]
MAIPAIDSATPPNRIPSAEVLEIAEPLFKVDGKVAIRSEEAVPPRNVETLAVPTALPETIKPKTDRPLTPVPADPQKMEPVARSESHAMPVVAAAEAPPQLETLPAVVPDVMPSILQGAYRAPLVAHHFSGAFAGESAPARGQALLHVMAPSPIAATSEHAQGRSFNANTYALSPATNESLAAHTARLANGQSLAPQRIVSGTHEAYVGHSLDFIA